VHTKNGHLYGRIPVEELVHFAAHNRHLYEIVRTTRKLKFYTEYDKEMVNTGQSPEEHEWVFKRLQEKGLADAESICGNERAVLSGSWRDKGDNVKCSLDVVRPDRFFLNHSAGLAMRAIATRLEADGNVYSRSKICKLPNHSKLRDGRVQHLITAQLAEHVLTTAFDPGETKLTLDVPPQPPSRRDNPYYYRTF